MALSLGVMEALECAQRDIVDVDWTFGPRMGALSRALAVIDLSPAGWCGAYRPSSACFLIAPIPLLPAPSATAVRSTKMVVKRDGWTILLMPPQLQNVR